ncbi:MAG TPA: cache domain-containing protein, partial [Anaeromyxobacteraceae bacterium]
MRSVSIRSKLVLAVVLILGASSAASALLVRSLYGRAVRAASEDALRSASTAYEDMERNDIEKLSTALDVLVGNAAIRDAFAARDRDRLYAATAAVHQTLKTEHGIGHWNFIEPETRKMFFRVHLPNKFGDTIERQGLQRAMARQETSAGKELGKSEFALRVARPFLAEGKVIGYIELGEGIQHFLGRMKSQTGNDFAMFIAKKFIDQGEWARTRGSERNSWDDWSDVVVVNSTTPDAMVDAPAIAGSGAAGQILGEDDRASSMFVRGVVPVRDASGLVVGGLVVRHDITSLNNGMRASLLLALGLLVGLALAASALIYLLVERLIFGRLRRMTGAMEDLSVRLAGGDYGVGKAVMATSDDEIGRFEKFFGEFLVLVGNTLRSLADRKQAARQ